MMRAPSTSAAGAARRAPAQREPRAEHQRSGSRAHYCNLTFERAMRFVLWAQQLRREPSIADIREHWECSRATAFRYRLLWRDVRGIVGEGAES